MHPPESVAVIGAGVIGSTIACTLSRNGTDTTVFDEKRAGLGVSEASFAWVNASASKKPESYWKLNRLGVDTHHRWRELGHAPWFNPQGCLVVADGQRQLRRLADDAKNHRELGAPVRQLDAEELQALRPRLSSSVIGANLYPDDGWVDPQHMVEHQLGAIAHRQSSIRTHCGVTELRPADGSARPAIRTRDGRVLDFDVVVLAAGNGSHPLLQQLGTRRLLTTGTEDATVGLSVETLPLGSPLESVIRAEHVSMRPTAHGAAVIADHATAARYRHGDPLLWELPPILLERAASLMPALEEAKIARVRVSERVMPLDGLPVIGWVAPGVYVVLTHSGLTLAPFLSEAVTKEIHGTQVEDLHDFRPERF